MKLRQILILVLLTGSLTAFGQSTDPFSGEWKVTWHFKNGQPGQADLFIKGSTGSWQNIAANPPNPCYVVKAPISVESPSADVRIIKLEFSEALRGCNDPPTIVLKTTDGKTITGKGGQHTVLTLSRE